MKRLHRGLELPILGLIGVSAALCWLTTRSRAGDAPAAADAKPATHAEAVAAWRAERLERLTRDDGWLSLVGLHWLAEGRHRFGGGENDEVRLPGAPPAAGWIDLADGRATLELAEGVAATVDGEPIDRVTLAPDTSGEPTVVELGSLAFHLIERGGRLGLRVKDRESPALADFAGLEYYPTDPAWRLAGRFEPYDPPKPVPIPNVLGTVEEQGSPGAVVFEVAGETLRLDALDGGEDSLFLIFGDRTNGRGTYGGGRFLYVARAGEEGEIDLDFNRAYSPPCAFTPYATCPLPPLQNKLAVAIPAGEKAAAH